MGAQEVGERRWSIEAESDTNGGLELGSTSLTYAQSFLQHRRLEMEA